MQLSSHSPKDQPLPPLPGRCSTARPSISGVWLVVSWLSALWLPAVVAQEPAERPENETADHDGGAEATLLLDRRGTTPILASYDFETPPASGPDAFRLFEYGEGFLDLSSAFRTSGERSMRLVEVPGDRSFAEFMGFFDVRREGWVFWQFYVLFANPNETANLAMAGPEFFLDMQADGHAFWLQTHEGVLRHRPGGKWRELFGPEAFRWYFVDWAYDVERGLYDLAIWEEGRPESPLIDLRRQRNTCDAHPSAVSIYSLIGDLEDRSSTTYFVDDLLVAVDPEVLRRPFAAPGRRQLFVQRFRQRWPTGTAVEDAVHRGEQLARDTPHEPGEALDSETARALELAADLLLVDRELERAEFLYRILRTSPAHATRALLCLSDLAHLRGDADAEREAREAIYGRLDFEENRR